MENTSPFCFLYINQPSNHLFFHALLRSDIRLYVCMCRLMLAGLNLRGFQLPGCKLQNHCKIYAVETATQRECCFSFWSYICSITLEYVHLFGGKNVHSHHQTSTIVLFGMISCNSHVFMKS